MMSGHGKTFQIGLNEVFETLLYDNICELYTIVHRDNPHQGW